MDINPNLRALNRFGLGARLGEAQAINHRQWLLSQINPGAALLRSSELLTTQALIEKIAAYRRNDNGGGSAARQAVRKEGRQYFQLEAGTAMVQAFTTTTPFAERLARFWSNHFAVSTQGEQMVAWLAGAYEREAIRPHVFGKFEDMVLASARHPAMLIYLDQARSVGPGSRGARNGRRGLNENYARELLELHTLGVGGGYTQQDVEQLALVLTGWSVGGLNNRRADPSPFAFDNRIHEPGSKQVVGLRLGEEGEMEGRRAIAWLARHPSTATFIATKLVRHFVSDTPHPNDVGLIRQVFLETGGDLAEVSRALVDLDDAFYGPSRKIRTPQDFVIAVGRALGLTSVDRQAFAILQQLRHPIWGPLSPAGYSDSLQDWADPDGLLKRAEFGRQISRKAGRNQQGDLSQIVDQLVESPNADLLKIALRNQSSFSDQLALLIASPDFQWR